MNAEGCVAIRSNSEFVIFFELVYYKIKKKSPWNFIRFLIDIMH